LKSDSNAHCTATVKKLFHHYQSSYL